jgi:hypothetical protein
MANDLLQRYTEACNYPGVIDDAAVDKYLSEYLAALKVERKIVRLQRGWKLDDYPSLDAAIQSILVDCGERRAARAARDALAARDARDALAARDARDARHRFAEWCIFRGSWWWSWEISWISTTYFGAKQQKNETVKAWSRPILDAFISGGWLLFWTDDTLYWVAKPTLHVDSSRRLHAEAGPAVICDIEDLYFWRGVMVPREWIEDRENLDPNEVIKVDDVEQRAAGAAICGWPKMLAVLEEKVIDKHPNQEIGSLIELTLPGLENPGRFLKAHCPRNGIICEGVPYVSDIDGLPIETAIAAQAWRLGDAAAEFQISPKRT